MRKSERSEDSLRRGLFIEVAGRNLLQCERCDDLIELVKSFHLSKVSFVIYLSEPVVLSRC